MLIFYVNKVYFVSVLPIFRRNYVNLSIPIMMFKCFAASWC